MASFVKTVAFYAAKTAQIYQVTKLFYNNDYKSTHKYFLVFSLSINALLLPVEKVHQKITRDVALAVLFLPHE